MFDQARFLRQISYKKKKKNLGFQCLGEFRVADEGLRKVYCYYAGLFRRKCWNAFHCSVVAPWWLWVMVRVGNMWSQT